MGHLEETSTQLSTIMIEISGIYLNCSENDTGQIGEILSMG